MLSKIIIGNRTFLTKKSTKMFLRDIRNSGFVSESDSGALQTFFNVSDPVESRYNVEMHQHELWSGDRRLSTQNAIDVAFADDDPTEIARIFRAAACAKARNAVFWAGSKRRAHLAAHPMCVHCGTDEKLEADHLEHCQFIDLWNAYSKENPNGYDETGWFEYHESRVEYQTLCRFCHREETRRRYNGDSSSETDDSAVEESPQSLHALTQNSPPHDSISSCACAAAAM